MLMHVSNVDYDLAGPFDNAHDVYKELQKYHENLGHRVNAQVHIMRETLDIRFVPSTPISHTINHIDRLHAKYTKMGKMDDDELKIVYLINALGDHYPRLQSTINELLDKPNVTSIDVKNRIFREEQFLIRKEKQGLSDAPDSTALSADVSKSTRPICSNCKRPNHRTEYCIPPGGKMAGKTIYEARAAQDAARPSQRRRPGGTANNKPRGIRNTAQNTPAASHDSNTSMVNGKCYILV